MLWDSSTPGEKSFSEEDLRITRFRSLLAVKSMALYPTPLWVWIKYTEFLSIHSEDLSLRLVPSL
jgi:hypothetical protein